MEESPSDVNESRQQIAANTGLLILTELMARNGQAYLPNLKNKIESVVSRNVLNRNLKNYLIPYGLVDRFGDHVTVTPIAYAYVSDCKDEVAALQIAEPRSREAEEQLTYSSDSDQYIKDLRQTAALKQAEIANMRHELGLVPLPLNDYSRLSEGRLEQIINNQIKLMNEYEPKLDAQIRKQRVEKANADRYDLLQ